MKKFLFVALLLFFLFTVNFSYAQKLIDAKGTAAIHKNHVDIARDRAISDALRVAVEKSVGVMISNETLVENYQVISDKILSKSKGYVQSYELVSDKRDDDMYTVIIQALVSEGQLKDDLDAIHSIIARKSKPRLMIVFKEDHQDDYMAESSMVKYFLSKGFKLVDPDTVRKSLNISEIERMIADPDAASKIGQRFGAEVMIICSVDTSSNPFKVGNVEMHSNSSTISAKVINVSNSNIISTGCETKRVPGIKDAIQDPVDQSSKALSSRLMEGIITKWSSELTNMMEVKLFVSKFHSYEQFNHFKELLMTEARGVEDVRQRSYSHGKAELEIDLRGNTQDLADDLTRINLQGRSVEIFELSQGMIEIELSP